MSSKKIWELCMNNKIAVKKNILKAFVKINLKGTTIKVVFFLLLLTQYEEVSKYFLCIKFLVLCPLLSMPFSCHRRQELLFPIQLVSFLASWDHTGLWRMWMSQQILLPWRRGANDYLWNSTNICLLSAVIWKCEENVKEQSWFHWHSSSLSHWPLLPHRIKIQKGQLIEPDGKPLVHTILYDMYWRPSAILKFYLKMPTTASLLPLKLEDLKKGNVMALHGVFIPHRPFYI